MSLANILILTTFPHQLPVKKSQENQPLNASCDTAVLRGMSDPITASEQRLQEYLSRLTAVLGHADRKARLVGYCTGLLLPGERTSVEPMAARLEPAQVPSLHQALHHFVATATWSDAAVLAAVREQVLPVLTRHGPITAWIIDAI